MFLFILHNLSVPPEVLLHFVSVTCWKQFHSMTTAVFYKSHFQHHFLSQAASEQIFHSHCAQMHRSSTCCFSSELHKPSSLNHRRATTAHTFLCIPVASAVLHLSWSSTIHASVHAGIKSQSYSLSFREKHLFLS